MFLYHLNTQFILIFLHFFFCFKFLVLRKFYLLFSMPAYSFSCETFLNVLYKLYKQWGFLFSFVSAVVVLLGWEVLFTLMWESIPYGDILHLLSPNGQENHKQRASFYVNFSSCISISLFKLLGFLLFSFSLWEFSPTPSDSPTGTSFSKAEFSSPHLTFSNLYSLGSLHNLAWSLGHVTFFFNGFNGPLAVKANSSVYYTCSLNLLLTCYSINLHSYYSALRFLVAIFPSVGRNFPSVLLNLSGE